MIFAIGLLLATSSAANKLQPKASVVDVPARIAFLHGSHDPRIRAAMASTGSCTGSPEVPAPLGRIVIPPHYLSGSHGPTNPAEAAATQVYGAFEKRITAGMNRYLATGNHAEAACALAQMDTWAKAGALLDYDPKESSQAWYQVEWTLSSAGVTDSVLVNDAAADAAQQARVTAWLNKAAHKLISYEKPGEMGNNHHYWRALAAISAGVLSGDKDLYDFGVTTFKQAVSEIDAQGAFPREMARHERALHYQGFALQPLVVIAEFATRQGDDLYSYEVNGHTIRDAIVFFGRAIDDPELMKPYASEAQDGKFGADDFAAMEYYAARFGTTGLPAAIVRGLSKPVSATRIGGSTTVLAGR